MSEAYELDFMEDLLEEDDFRSEMDANRAIERIAYEERQLEAMKEFHRRQEEAAEADLERKRAYYMPKFRRFFAQCPTKKTKTQESYTLPSGKLVLKDQQPKYTQDADALLPWVKANAPDRVKVKEEVDWAGLKPRVKAMPDGTACDTETGEIIPGVTVAYREPVFEVKCNG